MPCSHEAVGGEKRSGEAEDAGGDACAANSTARRGDAEQARDAFDERAAICGHSERGTLAPLFHERESAGVFDGIAANGERGVIAAIFAFVTDALVQPPNSGMIEKQRFGSDLKKIDEAIETANVREFVRDDRRELIFRKAAERGDGKQNYGTEPADNGGRFQSEAFTVTNRARDAYAALEREAFCEQGVSNGTGVIAAHAMDNDEAASGAKAEENDSGEPSFNEPQQSVRPKRPI